MTEQEARALVEQLKPFRPIHDIHRHVPDEEVVTFESAEMWAVRLLRIWSSEGNRSLGIRCQHTKGSFLCERHIHWDIHIHFLHRAGHNSIDMVSGRSLFLECSTKEGAHFGVPSDYSPETVAHFKPLVDEWMHFFRRGCWLSGCDIEATAHEKTEWIQGITREELETWNLKM